jgi:spermidine synthase
MVNVAKEYFGFNEDSKLKSVISDAYKYVLEEESKEKYDVILMDINYEEDNIEMSPPLKFIEPSFL